MADLFKVGENLPALNILFTIQGINEEIQKTQARIATGKLINKASDDPATFLTARLFESSISQYVAEQKEISRGIDFLEKNNARLDQVADIIIEINNLINTANSGSVTSAEQQAISREIDLLVDEIDSILLSGVEGKLYTGFSIGNLSDVSLTGSLPTASSLSLNGTNIVVTGTSAQFTTALSNVSSALRTILDAEESIGGYVKRLNFELSDNQAAEISARSELSTVRDADLAEEQVRLTALQILQQTSIAGLIQANNSPSAILSLIRT